MSIVSLAVKLLVQSLTLGSIAISSGLFLYNKITTNTVVNDSSKFNEVTGGAK